MKKNRNIFLPVLLAVSGLFFNSLWLDASEKEEKEPTVFNRKAWHFDDMLQRKEAALKTFKLKIKHSTSALIKSTTKQIDLAKLPDNLRIFILLAPFIFKKN